jgi:hypothetical protein
MARNGYTLSRTKGARGGTSSFDLPQGNLPVDRQRVLGEVIE